MISYNFFGAILAIPTAVATVNQHSPHSSLIGRSSSSDDSCDKRGRRAHCGMTVHAGETFKLEQDLVCTTTTDGESDTAVAITVEEGGTLLCDGHSIIQLNSVIGAAANCYQQSVTNCGLAWGAVGVELKSGATVEGCKAISGWLSGLKIAPPAGGYPKEIKIENCGATLNYYGLDIFPQQNLDVIDYSIKDRYVICFCE